MAYFIASLLWFIISIRTVFDWLRAKAGEERKRSSRIVKVCIVSASFFSASVIGKTLFTIFTRISQNGSISMTAAILNTEWKTAIVTGEASFVMKSK